MAKTSQTLAPRTKYQRKINSELKMQKNDWKQDYITIPIEQ